MYAVGFYKLLLFVKAFNETCFKGEEKDPKTFLRPLGAVWRLRGLLIGCSWVGIGSDIPKGLLVQMKCKIGLRIGWGSRVGVPRPTIG